MPQAMGSPLSPSCFGTSPEASVGFEKGDILPWPTVDASTVEHQPTTTLDRTLAAELTAEWREIP